MADHTHSPRQWALLFLSLHTAIALLPERMKLLCALLLTALLNACGGSFVSDARAGVEAPPVKTFLHAILRPAPDGRWYVQSDSDHLPDGISLTVEQSTTFVRIFFTQTYRYAGSVQVSSDDDFAGVIQGYSNLGLNNATIRVEAHGQRIDPAQVYQYVPQGSGNFWITVVMWK